MTFSIPKTVFLEKLITASRFTSNKLSSNNILQGVLLKIQEGALHIYSTNLVSFYHGVVPLHAKGDRNVVIDPRKILEFISLLEGGDIQVSVEEGKLKLLQGKAHGVFELIKSEEFPLLPAVKKGARPIKTSFLIQNLPLVLFSAAKDDTRPVLTGVNFIDMENALGIVTTDGFRLSLLKTDRGEFEGSMLIPGDFLEEVLKQAKTSKEVLFGYSNEEKAVLFSVGGEEFYSRIIEGEFPPFERVIPAEKKTTVTLAREELLRNIKLVSIFAREASNIVICEFTKRGLVMRPKNEAGQENVTQQDIEFEGEEQRVAFNYRFLVDFLNNTDSEKINIEILRSDAPVVFKNEKKKDYLHIIMPVRIQE